MCIKIICKEKNILKSPKIVTILYQLCIKIIVTRSKIICNEKKNLNNHKIVTVF